MSYPLRFSALTDLDSQTCSMRAYIEDVKTDTKTYMLLTPGIAINGEIYELDAISPLDDENKVGIVEFSPEFGGFIAMFDNDFTESDQNDHDIVFINSGLDGYEIVGNIFENWDELQKISYIGKYKEIMEQNKQEVEKARKAAEEKKSAIEAQQNESEQTSESEEKPEEDIGNESKTDEEKELTPDPETTEESKEEAQPTKKKKKKKKKKKNQEVLPDLPENDIDEPEENNVSSFDSIEQEIVVEPILNEEPDEPVYELAEPEEVVEPIVIYIDAKGTMTPGKGSWAYIMQSGMQERVDAGYENNTTVARMEIKAIKEALESITVPSYIKIVTTSKRIMAPFLTGWITLWKSNDWKKQDGTIIKNVDLWEPLFKEYGKHTIEWEYMVPGTSFVELLRCADIANDALNSCTEH